MLPGGDDAVLDDVIKGSDRRDARMPPVNTVTFQPPRTKRVCSASGSPVVPKLREKRGNAPPDTCNLMRFPLEKTAATGAISMPTRRGPAEEPWCVFTRMIPSVIL